MVDKFIDDNKLQEIIERLREEKSQWEDEYRSKGEEDGFEWSKSASIEEIRDVIDWNPLYRSESYSIRSLVDDAVEGDELMKFENPNYLNSFAYNYFCGWIDGVTKFWGVIKVEILLKSY